MRRAESDDRIVFANAAPIKDDNNVIIGAIVVFLDITDQRRAEVDQARLAAIVNDSNDAIISKDLNGTITTWNGGAQRLFGYSAEEAIGRSILMLVPPGLHTEEYDMLHQIATGKRIIPREILPNRSERYRSLLRRRKPPKMPCE